MIYGRRIVALISRTGTSRIGLRRSQPQLDLLASRAVTGGSFGAHKQYSVPRTVSVSRARHGFWRLRLVRPGRNGEMSCDAVLYFDKTGQLRFVVFDRQVWEIQLQASIGQAGVLRWICQSKL